MTGEAGARPLSARLIRRMAVPIILIWIAITATVSLAAPKLEEAGREHSVAQSPADGASMQAMKRVGHLFREFDSDSAVMVVLEGDQPLGVAAHRYYDELIRRFKLDTKHVQHVQDFWGAPLTAAGSQSADGKAAYVQLNLVGNQGETRANQSVEAVRDTVAHTSPPAGVKAYVAGPAALSADRAHYGETSVTRITMLTVVVILIMLLFIYRSIVTAVLMLAIVGIQLQAARGIVAALGHYGVIGLSTFATSLVTSLAIAAGTDYAIFLIGRYHEARQAGQDRETAYYSTIRGVSHVILGSGLTIAGATFCLTFTHLPPFQTMGIPCAIGILVGVAAALTLGPAVLTVASHFGLLDPKRSVTSRRWRRVGTLIVRWPVPILVTTCALALVGLLALPGFKLCYDDRQYIPADTPGNIAYQAAERHFSTSRLNPEVLLIETDQDLRNPAGMLVIDRISKAIFRVPGVARVQSITRPLGTPIEHTSIPFQISMQSATMTQNMGYLHDRMDDMLQMGDQMTTMIDTMQQMQRLMGQLADATHNISGGITKVQATTNEIRDHLADFDDFFRPLRSYFYWEPHCFDIPVCAALRSIFDALDGIDKLSENMRQLVTDTGTLDAVMPQMLALMPPMITTMKTMRTMMLTMHSTFAGLMNQMDKLSENASAMGQAFDTAKNDDSFYLPPEAFDNPDFKRGLEMFLTPDGKAVRFIISHQGDPATAEGISHIDPILHAAAESIKGTPLDNSKIYLGGTAAAYKDMRDGSKYDLMIAGLSALSLILIIMVIITRSLVAALVIVCTVLVSLGASFGLSVLIWQHLLGLGLHWLVLSLAVIVLLAVGSDYNLLLVARFKEEIEAGFNTGIIRAMGGTGRVVTAAGLVFAFTMGCMVISDLRVIGQLGTTICIGLLFDTLIVRSLMMPSVAAILGRWFWWPSMLHPRAGRPLGQRRNRVDNRGEHVSHVEQLASQSY